MVILFPSDLETGLASSMPEGKKNGVVNREDGWWPSKREGLDVFKRHQEQNPQDFKVE